jgi:glycosyltransferase involved in cell wall biosynthesis
MVLVEAMAAGLPIVTTDVGCVGELLRDGGEGLVVKKQSPQDFATAMQAIITDASLREKIGRIGFSSAKNFNSSNENYFTDWRSTYNISTD